MDAIYLETGARAHQRDQYGNVAEIRFDEVDILLSSLSLSD